MTEKPTYQSKHTDIDWGCDYFEVGVSPSIDTIKICYVKVNDIAKISESLAKHVLNTSWMTKLDNGSERAYRATVRETAAALVDIFKQTTSSLAVSSEFGEIMVSIGSARALEEIFKHTILPIAELWKPQVKQNEGFDFHTVCSNEIVNFGEAKYSSITSPHGNAITQAKGFIDEEKHLRDFVHLRNMVSDAAIENLNNDKFGVVASFSINADDPLTILRNAIKKARDTLNSDSISAVYLVGVSQ